MRRILALVLAAASAAIVATAGTAAASPWHDCAQYSLTFPLRTKNGEQVDGYRVVVSVKSCFNGARIHAYWDKKADLVSNWNANGGWHVVRKEIEAIEDLTAWQFDAKLKVKFSPPVPSIWGELAEDETLATPDLRLSFDGKCSGLHISTNADFWDAPTCVISPLPQEGVGTGR